MPWISHNANTSSEFFNAFFAATTSLMGGNEANDACSGKAYPARMETQAAASAKLTTRKA